MGTPQELERLFSPKSIALIGASNSIDKWGGFVSLHILKGGYKGKLFPVNPRHEHILGLPAYPTIADIPEPVDLGIVMVPADKVPEVIEEAGKKGIGGLVVITSGFSEVGADGAELERRSVEIAKSHGVRIVGPNTMGILNTYINLYAIGASVFPLCGCISFISQSGNLGTQMLLWAEKEGVGVDQFFGTGNEADITTIELLRYLARRESTRVILLYMEGIDDGRKLYEVLSETTRKKPVVVLKAGRTGAGARAALSHTGAMAGQADIFEAALRQAGCIVVKNPTDLLDMAVAFSYLPLPRGDGVAVCTLGGGWGVVASDLLIESGLELPPLDDEVISKLDKLLPPFWSRANPVDLVGQADLHIFTTSLHALLEPDYIDAVLTMGAFGSDEFMMRIADAAAELIPEITEKEAGEVKKFAAAIQREFMLETLNAMEQKGKPILGVSMSPRAKLVYNLNNKTLILFPTPERAVKALKGLYQYHRYISRVK